MTTPTTADPGRNATSQSPRRTGGGWRKRVLGVAAGYLAVVVGFAGFGLFEHYHGTVPSAGPLLSTGAPDRCPPGDAPPNGAAAPALAQRGTPVDSIAFGRSLGTQVREFDFTVADGLPAGTACLHTQANPFLRIGEQDSAQLDANRIVTQATVIGRQVRLVVAVMRTDARFAPSGTYTGTISINDPRVGPVDVPLTVSLAYPVWQLPLVVLLLTLPVAIAYLWLLKGSFHGEQPAGDVKIKLGQFDDYAFSRNGILAIGAGTASTVLVFSATYLSSPTWGSSFVDAITLFGGMFAAFAAASTPVTAAGSDRYDPLDGPDRTAAPRRDDPPRSTEDPAPAPIDGAAGAATTERDLVASS